ncbi:domesticated amidase effector 2-like [Centruroides vittatus]|uniref:domesticated amidase effector 2-like n=1 Tax=Centruroides vittatus TaxID=120091 RepID=UPI00350FA5B6
MFYRIQICILLLFVLIHGLKCYIRCQNPVPYSRNIWLSVTCSRNAVGLLRRLCSSLRSRSTTEWKKGEHVLSGCFKIPIWTAIATFLRDDGLFRGHAAIFESCANDGIWVYDQTPSSRMMRRKLKRIQLSSPHYNADNFYTIK